MVVLSGGKVGTIRWKGYPKIPRGGGKGGKIETSYKYGIELTGFGKGESDGSLNGKRYFKCSAGRAVFVGFKEIQGKPFNNLRKAEKLRAHRRRSSVLIESTVGDLSKVKEDLGPTKSKWKADDKVGVYCNTQNIWFEDGTVKEVSEDGTRVLVEYQKGESQRWLDDLDLENHLRQPGPSPADEVTHSWERPVEVLPEPATEPTPVWKLYANQVQTMHPHIEKLATSLDSRLTSYGTSAPSGGYSGGGGGGGGGGDYGAAPPAAGAKDIRVNDPVKTYFKAKGGERSPYQDPATVVEVSGQYCIVKFEDGMEQEVPLEWVDLR